LSSDSLELRAKYEALERRFFFVMKEEREKDNSVLRMLKRIGHFFRKTVRRCREIKNTALSYVKSTKDEYKKTMDHINQAKSQKPSHKVNHTSDNEESKEKKNNNYFLYK
jgi:hypothetical protein